MAYLVIRVIRVTIADLMLHLMHRMYLVVLLQWNKTVFMHCELSRVLEYKVLLTLVAC